MERQCRTCLFSSIEKEQIQKNIEEYINSLSPDEKPVKDFIKNVLNCVQNARIVLTGSAEYVAALCMQELLKSGLIVRAVLKGGKCLLLTNEICSDDFLFGYKYSLLPSCFYAF